MSALPISGLSKGCSVPASEPPLRSLARVFLPGADLANPFELPSAERDKFRKVLRLETGDLVALLPNDGSLTVARLDGRYAVPLRRVELDTEARRPLTLVQALPKGEKLEEIVRAGTEIGVTRFVVFPSERSVVRWSPDKIEAKLDRISVIAREAAELAFRARLPRIVWADSLDEVLANLPGLPVLSEIEDVSERLTPDTELDALAVGPEGGWSARELERLGRPITLGPRVLRTEHAGPAAAAILLLR